MIVCLCHRISDRDIARAAKAGCMDFETLQEELRIGTGCGACLECAQELHAEHCAGRQNQRVIPLLAVAA